MNKLEEYNTKRNFNKTSEPAGKTKKRNTKKLKFVIQHHFARREHFDLRLEWGGVLLSFAVPKKISLNPKDKRLAVEVEPHPLEYANFEGVIPEGEYGAGVVYVWDEGEWLPPENFEKDFKKGDFKFALNGQRVRGVFAMVRLKENEKQPNWLLIKEKDKFAVSGNLSGIEDFKTSVKTGKTADEINAEENLLLQKNPFQKIIPSLATLASKIPESDDFLFEFKYDGYRILAFAENGKVKLFSRNNLDFTKKFKQITKCLESFANNRAMVLDGEIIGFDEDGKISFNALQNCVKNKEKTPISYVIFDCLALDGSDLREKPLTERKESLSKLFQDFKSSEHYKNCSIISESAFVVGNGKKCFSLTLENQMEGIMAKRKNSNYVSGRSDNWLKIKCYKKQEFVVLGYHLSNKISGLGSLLVGYYDKEKLVFAGKVGTGFTEKERIEFEKEIEKIKIQKSKILNLPKSIKQSEVIWLKPKLVCEIQFAEFTKDNILRQPSFKGFRIDKNPKEIIKEISENIYLDKNLNNGGAYLDKNLNIKNPTKNKEKNIKNNSKNNKSLNKKENLNENKENNLIKKLKTKTQKIFVNDIEITSADRVVFPKQKLTKLDIVNYYKTVAKRMLPFVENRILSVVRCHNDVNGEKFFKKHPQGECEGVKIVNIKNSEGEKEEYFCAINEKGLISEAQLGTIEFHTWGSRFKTLEKPDIMVFDLDPDEKIPLSQVRQGVRDLKVILNKLNLKSFLKTSGGKGYHILVPFKPSVSWEKFYDFAKKVALVLESNWPERYTTNIRKNNRKNKIFIDYMRNGRASTSVAPYSLRARPDGGVSMPILWKELDEIAPNQITMEKALERIKKRNPWENFFKISQELKD